MLDHLPPPNQQLVRYWGHYSNVSRGKRRVASTRSRLLARCLQREFEEALTV